MIDDSMLRCRTSTLLLAVIGMWACEDQTGGPGTRRIVLEPSDVHVFESDSALHDVRDIALSRGMLWALSSFEPHLHAYDLSGRSLWTTGARGQGPGELGTPWSLVPPAPSDLPGIYIWDAGDRRLEGFSRAGEHASSIQLQTEYGPVLASYEAEHYGEPLRVRRLGSSLVLSRSEGQTTRPSSLWQSRLTLFDAEGRETKDLFSFAQIAPDPQDLPEVFAPAPLWTSCGMDRLMAFDPIDGVLLSIDSTGVTDSTSIAIAPVAVSRADVARWAEHSFVLAAREGGFDPDATESRALLDRFMAEVVVPSSAFPVALRCDAEGRAWLQEFATEIDPRGYGHVWHQPSMSVSVVFPSGFRPLIFDTDRVYGVSTDGLGVERIAWTAAIW